MVDSAMRLIEAAHFGERATTFKRYGTKSRHYCILGMDVVEYHEYYVGRNKKALYGEVVPLKDIFPIIKHVYDMNGILIARRNALHLPLILVEKGMGKKILLAKRSNIDS